jgi:hypothetical protein
MSRQPFLCGQIPGYTARAVQKTASPQSWSLSLELAVTRIVMASDAMSWLSYKVQRRDSVKRLSRSCDSVVRVTCNCKRLSSN